MSRARDLSRLSNPTNFTPDATTGRVGLGSENPTAKLNVAGIVSATAFYGDGSNLEGVASAGLGTALAESGAGTVIYYTDKILGIAGNITVDVPDASNSNVAYTQYEEISVESGIDFIVADGDDFVPDILGLSTAGITPLAGTGGRIRADNFTNKAGTGAPTFQTGVVVTGVATATTFSGNATTATTATNAQGLTGTPNIDCGTGSFTGDVDIADKIVHTGDTNTAIRFPAVDTFTVETAGSERLRITSAGEVQIANGNLKFSTAGTGIDFSATSDTGGMTSELLDDYEEGTFTPSLKFGGANVGLVASTSAGKYTKIGRMVHYFIQITLTSKGSSSGTAIIEDMPLSSNGNYATTVALLYNANSLTGPVLPRVLASGTNLALNQNAAGGYATVSNTNFNNDSQLQIVGTYFT